jgi:hypothetical protein
MFRFFLPANLAAPNSAPSTKMIAASRASPKNRIAKVRCKHYPLPGAAATKSTLNFKLKIFNFKFTML